jgi:uncharacterized RDD family membrane protein YckC
LWGTPLLDSEVIPATPAYGRFSRRLQAVLIDSIIFLVLMAAALSIMTALQSNGVGRILGFAFLAILLLYEPVLVPLTGGTIGHYLCNLRVVDDRTNGNIGFLKAVARATIKCRFAISRKQGLLIIELSGRSPTCHRACAERASLFRI